MADASEQEIVQELVPPQSRLVRQDAAQVPSQSPIVQNSTQVPSFRQDSTQLPQQGTVRQDSTQLPQQGTVQKDSTQLPQQASVRQDSTQLPHQGTVRQDSTQLLQQGTVRQDSTQLPQQGTVRQDSTQLPQQGTIRQVSTQLPQQGTVQQDSTQLPQQGTIQQDSTELPQQGTVQHDSTQLPQQGTVRQDSTQLPQQGTVRHDSTQLPQQGTVQQDSTELPQESTVGQDSTQMLSQGSDFSQVPPKCNEEQDSLSPLQPPASKSNRPLSPQTSVEALQSVDQKKPPLAPILQEGMFQPCEGYLARRTRILKRWKKATLFAIFPGAQNHEFRKIGKQQITQHLFPMASANKILIEPLSTDPKSKDFLGFRILKGSGKKQKEKGRYRAEDIIQMRRFMASLGGMGPGLFSRKQEQVEAPVETILGRWDILHPSDDELFQGQQAYESMVAKEEKSDITVKEGEILTYAETVQQLPIGFYFPENKGGDATPEIKENAILPGTQLPIYDPSTTFPKSFRRRRHDTFRPPYGPPVFSILSIGYGPEVDVDPGVQVLWNPLQNSYFFIDHIRHVTFYEDPRPPRILPPPIEQDNFDYGDQHHEEPPLGINRDPEVVRYAANRARDQRLKPHGFVLKANGMNGTQGHLGRQGQDGPPGNPGSAAHHSGQDGGTGEDGVPGGTGTPGISGTHGTGGSDLLIKLDGNADELRVSGRMTFTAKLGGLKHKEVLFVDCSGGNGGDSGKGGVGGRGGDGGPGGHGAPGKDGRNSSNGRGGNGGPGGDGGDGGDGGQGGSGGPGGSGGNAGPGGICVVSTKDPQLLALVEIDCMNGRVGKGGDGGDGGAGGYGGSGGSGGPGGRGGYGTWKEYSASTNTLITYRANGANGPHGRHGNDGRTGENGQRGAHGKDGAIAPNGGIMWHIHASGGVLHQSGTRYEARVTNFNVVSGIDDGIFEPNERIAVSGVEVVNTGGLPLPAGAKIYIPSDSDIAFHCKFEPTSFILPEMKPSEKFVVPVTFYGRIFDRPSPNEPGPHVSSAQFSTRVDMLGRPFVKSFCHQPLRVEYPVKLAQMRCTENIGRGEVALLEIDVQNISSLPYGSCPHSGGEVTLQLHLDARLTPVGYSNVAMPDSPYTVTFDPKAPDSLHVQMNEIPPGASVTVQIAVQMDSQAELFQRCFWQADIFLREKLIEYNHAKIRVSPFYIPKDPPGDVLVITDENITREEFVFWQRILETANVTTDFWDTTRYNGLSVDMQTNTRHPVTWEGRYKGRLILYPHCNLQMLYGVDIARHFHGTEYRDGEREDLNSGMVLFMPATSKRPAQDTEAKKKADAHVIRHLALVDESLKIPDRNYGGSHFSQPKTLEPCLKVEQKMVKSLEKKDQSRSVIVTSREVDFQSMGFFKYSYGAVDVRQCPLLRSCKFLAVDGAGGNVTDIGRDDSNFSPMSLEIPLASNYGQVFLATMFGLPLACKLNLIKNEDLGDGTPSINPTFYLPNELTLNKVELAAICAAQEIAEEVFSCSGSTHRMNTLTQDVTNNTPAYATNGKVVLQALQLINIELEVCKKRLNNSDVTKASNNIKRQFRQVEGALHTIGIDGQKLRALPRWKILHEDGRMYRSHQYSMKDNCWNVAN